MLAEGYDVGLRLHESFANNAARFFAGKTFTNEDLDRQLQWLARPVRKPPPLARTWSMTYAREQPMQVTFADHRIRIVMRSSRLIANGQTYPGVRVIVVYRLMPAPEGVRAVRVGGVQVLPWPGATFGPRERVVAALVKQRMEQLYAPALVAKRPRAPKQLSQAGPLRPLQADTNDGWLIVAWKRVNQP